MSMDLGLMPISRYKPLFFIVSREKPHLSAQGPDFRREFQTRQRIDLRGNHWALFRERGLVRAQETALGLSFQGFLIFKFFVRWG